MLQGLNEVFVGEEFGDYNEKSYGDIRTYEEFYLWAQGPFTEGLLPAEYYDGSVRTPAPTPTFPEGLLPWSSDSTPTASSQPSTPPCTRTRSSR